MPEGTLTVSVGFADQRVDLDVDLNQKVGDLIKSALLSFKIDEDPEDCGIWHGDRRLMPEHDLGEADLGDGAMLTLTVPF